ncbi:hypothetical protein [Bradyrhizobium iriomotense]|uniref:KTSC domain-containing protein n=1 Tax=Bradyrhizobium iriomotense TaxID=441950 RepID=A0ABQ6B9T3_9BRAD|nr:hypothetical protein [Bradyrhizobium iriomotense]GLR91122.1 hypothetical protein GCM10007857_78380 [Bradyrhizobium iriomotense]
MPKHNLKRIALQVPLDNTDTVITVDADELRVEYLKGGYEGRTNFVSEIPADWTDQDLAKIIWLPIAPRATRNRQFRARGSLLSEMIPVA